MANPGAYRHLVDIVGPGTGPSDGAGGYTAAAPVAMVESAWALIEELTGTEQVRAMQSVGQATHRVTLREWYSGINAGMWVEFEERRFDIIAPPSNPGELRREMILLTRENT